MNKKCLFAVVIVLVSLICLSACGALRDTADKNKALNESLPYYGLNAANYDEISYNGLTYTITDECLEMSELQEEIGQVSKRFKNVAGEDFSFGYVYSIVDVDISNAVAVNINNISSSNVFAVRKRIGQSTIFLICLQNSNPSVPGIITSKRMRS